MHIKSEKKKKVFSSSKDVNEYSFDLSPEYVHAKTFKDEDLGPNVPLREHEIIIKIPIDKKAAIENGARSFTAYIVKNSVNIKAKHKPFAGFRQNKASQNYAIYNKELLAKKHLKQKDVSVSKYKLFDINVTSTALAGLSIEKIKNSTPEEAFGTETFLVPSQVFDGNVKGENKTNTDLSILGDQQRNTGEFFPLNDNVVKNSLTKFNVRKFKKEYVKMKRSGLDPAVFISKARLTSQSQKEAIKGQVPENFSKKSNDPSRISHIFHAINQIKIKDQLVTVTVKKEKRIKEHVMLKRKISLTQSVTNMVALK